MTKKLNDILKGVKSSKTITPDLKDIYSWEGGKSGEDFIKKHKIEKHEDRVGNDDDVYKGKTKPAKYPRQSNSVYEGADCSCSKNESSCGVHGKKKKMLLDKDMKEAVTPKNKESNPFSTTTGSNNSKETTPKSETSTTPKKSLKEIFKLDEISKEKVNKYVDKSSKEYKEYSRVADNARHEKKFSPDKKSEYKAEEDWARKKMETRKSGLYNALKKRKGMAKVNATEDVEINEVAPPNPKIEKWIKSNKDNFIKEYGRKKGMEVLYAKAWKMHNEQSSSPATNTEYAGPGAAGWTTGRMDTGTV